MYVAEGAEFTGIYLVPRPEDFFWLDPSPMVSFVMYIDGSLSVPVLV